MPNRTMQVAPNFIEQILETEKLSLLVFEEIIFLKKAFIFLKKSKVDANFLNFLLEC